MSLHTWSPVFMSISFNEEYYVEENRAEFTIKDGLVEVKYNRSVEIVIPAEAFKYDRENFSLDLYRNDVCVNPLGLDINYIQADDTGIIVPGRSLTKIVSGDGTKLALINKNNNYTARKKCKQYCIKIIRRVQNI